VTSATKALPASRILSAAGALLITSALLLAVGLGFPPPAAAQAVQRPASLPATPKKDAVKVATSRPRMPGRGLGVTASRFQDASTVTRPGT
jgi:hypothetical protein